MFLKFTRNRVSMESCWDTIQGKEKGKMSVPLTSSLSTAVCPSKSGFREGKPKLPNTRKKGTPTRIR